MHVETGYLARIRFGFTKQFKVFFCDSIGETFYIYKRNEIANKSDIFKAIKLKDLNETAAPRVGRLIQII